MKGLAERDALWLGGLLLGAIILLGSNLDGLPLRDWDEATVAQVAREIWQAPAGSQHWLFPTLWGEPYLNKPPLVHNAVAWAYRFWGDREGAARLPGAICTGLSVLSLYGVGRELFPRRQTAFLGAALYLTTLPVVRHGRLAMLDGAVLCFATLACWCLLRARRDLRWSLGAGLAWGLLCLTKGVALGGLFGAIALGFLAWDTPRLLASPFWWGGMLLGSAPAWGWYWLQSARDTESFVRTALLQQNFSRIWEAVDRNAGPPWYYLDKLLQALPGLPVFLAGCGFAWQQRRWSWAKLVLCWSGIYFACISAIGTKLPWYLLPVYPPLALAGGAMLTAVLESPNTRPYPRIWGIFWGVLGLAGLVGGIYYGFLASQPDRWVGLALLGLALTLLVSARLLWQRDGQFVAVLLWGTLVALWLLFQSGSWNWELNEAFPARPVGQAIAQALADDPETPTYTSFEYERPSLSFYSQRRILSKSPAELRVIWQERERAYLIVTGDLLSAFQPPPTEKVPLLDGWWLIARPED